MEASAKTRNKSAALHIWDSVLSGMIVLYATYLIKNFIGSKGLLSVLFFLMAAENAICLAEGKRTKTQRFCVMALYLAGAVLILVLDPFHSSLLAAAVVEFVVILFNRVMAILRKPKKRVIALNVICILIIVAVGFLFFTGDQVIIQTMQMDETDFEANPEYSKIVESIDSLDTLDLSESIAGMDLMLFIALMLVILWRMILHVVGISISQMKLNILMNIIRETYVLEILLGLLLMIIACSTVFSTLEDSMRQYGDALWYCFALVTTIGFGDITATTVIGRILSVFLGMYGIVVVAIITSVIVNFYGEMRRMTGQKADEDKEKDTDE